MTEHDVNKAPHNSKESLITKIMEIFTNLSRKEVVLACNRFRRRQEKVVEANGDFIEYIFSILLNKDCHKKLCFYLVSKYVIMREREKVKICYEYRAHPVYIYCF